MGSRLAPARQDPLPRPSPARGKSLPLLAMAAAADLGDLAPSAVGCSDHESHETKNDEEDLGHNDRDD